MSYDTQERLSAAMQDIVGDRPYAPDLAQIESRGRKLRHRRLAWRATAGTSFAAAAIAAVAVATTGTGAHAPATPLAAPKPAITAEQAPLVRLVGYLTTAKPPAGDATLLQRDTIGTDGSKIEVWDLHADNGDYYFARSRRTLPGQVEGAHKQADKAGRTKVVAAAKAAAKGDLNAAREKMALAYVPKNPKIAPTLEAPGVRPSVSPELLKAKGMTADQVGNITDNWVWNNSIDALITGAGSPTVRAGVLRLLGQMPEVKVSKATANGRAVLDLAAGSLATGNGTETLTIDAESGLPIKFASGGVTVNYTVTRVTLADVAAGKF
jgi:hypothetical protein